ncbi:MAG TPA: D-aminoacylase [Alcaligenes sp.]|nr:D-aminoacylase [Alcaligenes sp.]HRL26486.1 D-aminoacylase [Alcaligenes sp.]
MQADERRLDVKISDGWIVDGTAAPRWRGDLGIRDGRIVALGDLSAWSAQYSLDADGKVVAPGFIDTHGHDDLMFIEKPALDWKTSQGITSVVVGNCGVSGFPAPLPGNSAAALALLGESPLFADMADYVQAVQALRPMINVAALVGHANLRMAVMADPMATPTDQEQAQMQAVLDRALEQGAVGFSTGLAYEPGCMAQAAELEGLARVAAARGSLHTSHIRNEGDTVQESVQEVLDVGRQTDCATLVSHHKCMLPANWGRSEHTLANIDQARAAGLQAALDIYPYSGSSTILIPERAHTIEKIRITWSEPHPECNGQYLADIARQWGCDREAAARKLLPAGAIYFAMDEQEVQRIFSHPCCMVGSDGLPADAHPHPRLWGSFTRILGRYVREDGLMPLEQAVAKMTALPASVFGLQDRGVLRPGAWADVVVFDPDTVQDCATWEQPTLPSEGVQAVFVNGVQVHPQAPQQRPGQVLTRAFPARAQSLAQEPGRP